MEDLTGTVLAECTHLKASYFPNVPFLNAELGSRPSQIWRAILEGRDILRQGIIRRIGNGQTTDIWDDNWIPKEASLRPITSLVSNPPRMVSELLLPATASWNEELIRATFLPINGEAILRIPVCTRNISDFWRGTLMVGDCLRSVQHISSWSLQKSNERIGWKEEQVSRTRRRKRIRGLRFGAW